MDIKHNIKNFILVHNKLTELGKEMKDLRAKKKLFGDFITDYMLKNSENSENPTLEIGESTFKVKKCKASKKFNKNIVKDILEDKLDNPTIFREICKEIDKEDPDPEEIYRIQYKKK